MSSKYTESKDYDSESKAEFNSEAKSDSKLEFKSDEKKEENFDLLENVQAYFYESEDLAKTLENFVLKKCNIVDINSEEYKLEYTQAFEDYKELFEEKMEKYIVEDLNSSIKEFYFQLKKKMEEDKESSEAFFGQVLLAVTEFDVFMTMMKEAALSFQTKADHK